MSRVKDILSESVRVNDRSDCVYFFDGVVCADIIGPEEQRKSVLRLVGQAREMARALQWAHNNIGSCDCSSYRLCPIAEILKDAGVSVAPVTSEGT